MKPTYEQLEAQAKGQISTQARTILELQAQVKQLAAENVALKSGIGFFSYGTDIGYEEHATADDAIKAADSDIDYYRGLACDGWSEETDRTVWGVVIQRASMIGLHTETDDSGNKREICDYALLPVVETPATDAFISQLRNESQWIEGSEPAEFGRYWVRYETAVGPQYCTAKWMEYNFCASSSTNIHKIWLDDRSRSVHSMKGVTHYAKLPDALELREGKAGEVVSE